MALTRNYITLLASGGGNAVINCPGYGYKSKIVFPVRRFDAADGTSSFCADAYVNYRYCDAAAWALPADQMLGLELFWQNHRTADITISRGANPTGFFVFGPDQGDTGQVTARIAGRSPSAMQTEPFRWYKSELALVMTSALQTLDPVERYDRGSLVFYTMVDGAPVIVQGLPWPDGGFDLSAENRDILTVGRTGGVTGYGGRIVSERLVTSFNWVLSTGLAKELIECITAGLSEDADVFNEFYLVITAGAPFGIGTGYPSGTYKCSLLGSEASNRDRIELEIEHAGFDRFKLPLCLLLKSALGDISLPEEPS